MAFATLQEAWGVQAFGTTLEEPVNKNKEPEVQRETLERAEASQRNWLFANEYIRQVYQHKGAAGVLGLMDAEIVKSVQTNALLSFEWLDSDAMLLGFLFVCALWLLSDAFRK